MVDGFVGGDGLRVVDREDLVLQPGVVFWDSLDLGELGLPVVGSEGVHCLSHTPHLQHLLPHWQQNHEHQQNALLETSRDQQQFDEFDALLVDEGVLETPKDTFVFHQNIRVYQRVIVINHKKDESVRRL